MTSQRSRFLLAAVTMLLCFAPAASQAIDAYSQNFEGLNAADTAALGADGWVVFGNVFSPTGDYLYGYGTFPAPNDGSGFCQIDSDQGGVDQGAQQLVVYSDYNNLDHANGNLIESNVFHEQTVTAADLGHTWRFSFDAKLGNLVAPSTAAAFIKTLDPTSGYATTNYVTVDMTSIPETWGGYTLSLAIADSSLVGQLFQFGFTNTATLYASSGVFYDNVSLAIDDVTGVPFSTLQGVALHQNYPNPFNPSTRIDFSLDQPGTVELAVFDVAGHKVTTLQQGSLAAGDHHLVWNGRTDAGEPVASGRYSYVLRTATGQTSRSMILLK